MSRPGWLAFRNNETNQNYLRSSNDRVERKGHVTNREERERERERERDGGERVSTVKRTEGAFDRSRCPERAFMKVRIVSWGPFYFIDSTTMVGREPRNERHALSKGRFFVVCCLQLEDDKTNIGRRTTWFQQRSPRYSPEKSRNISILNPLRNLFRKL